MGEPLPSEEVPSPDQIQPAGTAALRVIGTVPATAGLYRLDLLIAALARRSLWLTDAYFIGSAPYVQALRAAARDDVDVRLLVPGATDIPLLRGISRAAYQPLLEAGVRVFEWNGPMIHAKTAVADGRWARVGSTNLNIASWMGNYELDVAVEDQAFARAMENMYQEDLRLSTEVVVSLKGKVRLSSASPRRFLPDRPFSSGSVGRAGIRAIRLGGTVGAAITNHRLLGAAEAKITGLAGLLLLAVTLLLVFWPRWATLPLIVFCAWIALSLLIRTFKLFREKKSDEQEDEISSTES
jgi:cardiolipin synthase